MDLQKAREKFAEINLKHGFYTQKELKFTDLGVFECTAAEQDFDMWWECLIYYAQPLIDQKEKALLEQFEINNKLVEQVEKLKAQAVPEGFVVVPKEPTEKMNKAGLQEYRKVIGVGQDDIGYIYKAMIEAAQE
ncbi:MAG: hypothetical protein PHW70_02665 [Acinetobacter towneri]|nr:hypothetical protein [Acinetobacter towneri]